MDRDVTERYTSKLTGPIGKVGDATEVKQPMQVCEIKAGIMLTEYKYKHPFLYVHNSGNCRILTKSHQSPLIYIGAK